METTPTSSAIVFTWATNSASETGERTKRGAMRVGSTASGSTHGWRRSVLAGIFFFPCHRPGSANGNSQSAFECRRPFGVAGPTGSGADSAARRIVDDIVLSLTVSTRKPKKSATHVAIDAVQRAL